MLPKQIADKLKLGEFVEPEQFSAATIFFSDVVSSTTLASKCSPLQPIRDFENSVFCAGTAVPSSSTSCEGIFSRFSPLV
uniref:Uncharacterized protein n=1 Tax=Meloidogyne enterolobii TaxID=390850 RepID=A0A6V7WQN6_MELEN|nr:unnamed protein product [Meloidogyne enterolobii]